MEILDRVDIDRVTDAVDVADQILTATDEHARTLIPVFWELVPDLTSKAHRIAGDTGVPRHRDRRSSTRDEAPRLRCDERLVTETDDYCREPGLPSGTDRHLERRRLPVDPPGVHQDLDVSRQHFVEIHRSGHDVRPSETSPKGVLHGPGDYRSTAPGGEKLVTPQLPTGETATRSRGEDDGRRGGASLFVEDPRPAIEAKGSNEAGPATVILDGAGAGHPTPTHHATQPTRVNAVHTSLVVTTSTLADPPTWTRRT